jgi:peptide-methionine (R)-S-oxide reductase
MKDGEIKNKLSPAQVSVMRHRVTEPPYFGKYWDMYDAGTYRCAACDTPLFNAAEKFDSKTGWPTFKKPINEKDLQFKSEPGPDDKVEVRCKKCKSHLGYVIPNDPPYYRINSVCMKFDALEVPEPELPEQEREKKSEQTGSATEQRKSEAAPAAIAAATWSFPSLAAGAAVGFIVGAGGVLLYCMNVSGVLPPTATSTAETATTTDIELVPEDEETSTPETAPEVLPVETDTGTPVETLDNPAESPLDGTSPSTSTP